MTRTDLSQIYFITRELERAERALKELEASISPKSQNMNGMPGGSGTSDPTATTAIQMALYRDQIEKGRRKLLEKEIQVEEYCESLDDHFLRLIIKYRCVDLMTWGQVAAKIGAGTTADSCRKYFWRNQK